ncbi:MAG TPA: penicillin-binding protein activator LpoB [Burkholderiales bacterium]|nr:penicillin-binding protein activator LpoB [Burkholderiales bacterium]
MSHRPFLRAGLALVALVAASACSTKVERLDESKAVDLSGGWNDTDSRMVSQEMIQDSLSRAWLQEFRGRPGQTRPAVIVGEVRNLSHEHINTNTFTLDLERALINSGKVDFVATKQERQGIRDERKDQDLNAREETRNAMGRELGADFMLTGTINTIVDPNGSEQLLFYQVNMTLISLKDNRKVWVGQKDIRKLVTRSKMRF